MEIPPWLYQSASWSWLGSQFSWPANFNTRAPASAPIWTQSAHTHKLNTPSNEALRTISGCLRSTRTNFLPALAGIEPLEDRSQNACEKLFQLTANHLHLLHQMLYRSPKLMRLRSQHPLRNLVDNLSTESYAVPEVLAKYIPAWSQHPSRCYLPRKPWVQLNRLHRGVGRFAAKMHRWGFQDLLSVHSKTVSTYWTFVKKGIIHDGLQFKGPKNTWNTQYKNNDKNLKSLSISKIWTNRNHQNEQHRITKIKVEKQ